MMLSAVVQLKHRSTIILTTKRWLVTSNVNKKRKRKLPKQLTKTTTRDRIVQFQTQNKASRRKDQWNTKKLMSLAQGRMSYLRDQLYAYWNPDYKKTGEKLSAPPRTELVMDERWWFWNIAFALLPSALIALYCQFVIQPQMVARIRRNQPDAASGYNALDGTDAHQFGTFEWLSQMVSDLFYGGRHSPPEQLPVENEPDGNVERKSRITDEEFRSMTGDEKLEYILKQIEELEKKIPPDKNRADVPRPLQRRIDRESNAPSSSLKNETKPALDTTVGDVLDNLQTYLISLVSFIRDTYRADHDDRPGATEIPNPSEQSPVGNPGIESRASGQGEQSRATSGGPVLSHGNSTHPSENERTTEEKPSPSKGWRKWLPFVS